MKKFFTLFFLVVAAGLMAQPINDDCAGVIDLGVAPYCPDDEFFTNVDATPTDIGNDNIPDINSCMGIGPMENDVWFSFIASDTIDDYTITVTGLDDGMGGTAMQNPQVAIYRGDCGFDDLELLSCEAAENGEFEISLNVDGLDAGLPYFIRITDWSATAADNWGTFKLCVKEKDPIIILDDDVVTNLCNGEVYDSGGPDGDYMPGESYTFTIQPPSPVNCINFTLEYYNIEAFGDAIIFYDGPNTSSPQIGNLFGQGGGGAVCFQVQATSGALTLQFTSDASAEFEGFHGFWECSSLPCEPIEQITASSGVTDQQIIDAISTPLTQVTITDITCDVEAYGTFENGDNTDLGLGKGLLLTSGSADNVANPGNVFSSEFTGTGGDPDLDYLSVQNGNGQPSNDVCIVELDVFVATDELRFEYVFGSEEYPEFVGSSFNDIFAFLISGPGIAGDPNIANQENIAILPPPGNVPVQINSVNNIDNWEFYRNNLNGPSVVYDGLTSDYLGVKKSLTAIAQVVPCTTYHLKLAIADRGDTAYDSGVFISELEGGVPSIDVVYNNGIEYLVEECTVLEDQIIIGFSEPQSEAATYSVVIGGTATPNVDYVLNIPSVIEFLPGQTSLSFPIQPITDGIPEGVETIEISLLSDFGCGEIQFGTLVIELYDELNIEVQAGADTSIVCQDVGLALQATGAQNYLWFSQEPNIFNPSNMVSTPIANPTFSQNVFVIGSLGVCTDIDTVWLQVVDPQIEIVPLGGPGICVGDSLTLVASNNLGSSNLQWTGFNVLPNLFSDTVFVAPTFASNFTYTASVSIAGCSASDNIVVGVDNFAFPSFIAPDTTICKDYSVVLANTIPGFTNTQFEWTPDLYLNDNQIPNATATPQEDITYTLVATSINGYCSDSASVSIEVIPADVEILAPLEDTLNICLGTVVDLNALTTTQGAGFTWIPNDGSLVNPSDTSTIASPTVTTNYIASLTVGACTVLDSVLVRVDSLPELAISQLIPDKDSYCEGELITITSPTYEPANFPDITHEWIPSTGQQTPDSLWNLVILATESLTYQRITTNKGCVDTAEVFIEVVPVGEVTITPSFVSICVGESVQLVATSDVGYDGLEWSPAGTLSCDDCPDPTATPESTTTYQLEVDFDGCPVQTSATVEVLSLPEYLFPSNPVICPGGSIQLNLALADPDATYSWFNESGTLVSNDPFYTPTLNQTSTFTLIIEKGDCQPVEGEITVVVNDEDPIIEIIDDIIICQGNTGLIWADVTNYPGTVTWSPGGQVGDTILVNPVEPTTYTATFISADSCVSGSVSVFVDVTPPILIDSLVADPSVIGEGGTVILTAYTNPSELVDPTYLWVYEGDTLTTSINTASITAISVDEEEVLTSASVFVTDGIGCSAFQVTDITVTNTTIDIPNIFTPNGDGTNDFFALIKSPEVEILEFKIYNRWGQLVYDNENGDQGWDGTHKDKPAPSDVYAYYVQYRFGDGTEGDPLKGEVTLLR